MSGKNCFNLPVRVVIGIILICIAFVSSGSRYTSQTAAAKRMAEDTSYYTYLPMLRRDNPPFTGRLTDNGVPVAGKELYLAYSNPGGNGYTLYTTSNADGSFIFPTTPDVNTDDQSFYVFWDNHPGSNLSWLLNFYCNTVTSTNKDYYCDINIHNVPLISPPDKAHIKTPAVFSWQIRPTSTDNYIFNIKDPNGYPSGKLIKREMHYVGSQLIAFPASDYQVNTLYYWWVDVRTPEGWGMGNDVREIYLSNVGQ